MTLRELHAQKAQAAGAWAIRCVRAGDVSMARLAALYAAHEARLAPPARTRKPRASAQVPE